MPTVLEDIRSLLAREQVPYKEMHHGPTYTSAEAAAARGEPLHLGGKALMVKVGEWYRLFVMPADHRLDSKAVRTYFAARRIRFASPDELRELTGLAPGSVPPFGRPVLDFELYVDEQILANERIAFNAGSLCDSMIIPMADYLRVAKPQATFAFSTPPT